MALASAATAGSELRERLLGELGTGGPRSPFSLAGYSDADMELTELNDASDSWPHTLSATELVDALFNSFVESARVERERVQRLQLPDTAAKANRRTTYLDPRLRSEWQARSMRFLERRGDVVRALSTTALYSALAMQHLLELDRANFHLPAAQRRSEDRYVDGVCEQFLLDAPRSRYVVAGEVLHFPEAHAAGETQQAFASRLTSAVRREAPAGMVSVVTTAMSQSGLAALERASMCNAAVSGGQQTVEYTLRADPANPKGALVTLQVDKRGFREYLMAQYDEPMPSDACSSLHKSAMVSFTADGDIDVLNFIEKIDIRRDGCPLPAEALCDEIPCCRSGAAQPGQTAWQTVRGCTAACVRCFWRCREAYRDARAPAFGHVGVE